MGTIRDKSLLTISAAFISGLAWGAQVRTLPSYGFLSDYEAVTEVMVSSPVPDISTLNPKPWVTQVVRGFVGPVELRA